MPTSLFHREFLTCISCMQIGDILVHLTRLVYVTNSSHYAYIKKTMKQDGNNKWL